MERLIKTRNQSREKFTTQPKKTYSLMSRAASMEYELSNKARLMVQRVSLNSFRNPTPIKNELESKYSTNKKNFLVQRKSSEDIKHLKDLKIAFKFPNFEKRESKIKIHRSKSPLTKLGIENKSFGIEGEKSKQHLNHSTRRSSLGKISLNSKKTGLASTFRAVNNQVFEVPRTVSKHTYRTLTGSVRGISKRFNQDAYIIKENFANTKNAYFFGVFDGHGTYGHNVSNLLKESIPNFIEVELRNTRKKICRF